MKNSLAMENVRSGREWPGRRRGSPVAARPAPVASDNHVLHTFPDGSRVVLHALCSERSDNDETLVRELARGWTQRCSRGLVDDARARQPRGEGDCTGGRFGITLAAIAECRDASFYVGLATYSADTRYGVCEATVAAADGWERHQAGRLLMCHVIRLARNQGFRRLVPVASSPCTSASVLASAWGCGMPLL